MGLLDLPAPFLSGIDEWLTPSLPPMARLILWAVLGALVSMELYLRLSPQPRIKALRTGLRHAQNRVAAYDGDFQGALPLIRGMLSLALRRVLIVLPSTVIASLPLLALIVWLDTAYGRTFPPPGAPVSVEVPDGYDARWTGRAEGEAPSVEVFDGNGKAVAHVPVTAPVPVVHKRRWWNMLIGNPAGYLPDEAPVERIGLGLPRQQVLSFGPDWLRGWEAVYFASLVLFALAFKVVRRIE